MANFYFYRLCIFLGFPHTHWYRFEHPKWVSVLYVCMSVSMYERKKVSCYLFGKWYVLDFVMPKLNVRYDYTRTDLFSHLAKEIIRGITHYRLRRQHCPVNRLTWLWQIVFHVFSHDTLKWVIELDKSFLKLFFIMSLQLQVKNIHFSLSDNFYF